MIVGIIHLINFIGLISDTNNFVRLNLLSILLFRVSITIILVSLRKTSTGIHEEPGMLHDQCLVLITIEEVTDDSV